MNQIPSQKREFGTIAWGAVFVWWGILELVPFPKGVGALGLGLILLGLNAVRARSGMVVSGFSTTLGILALVLGGLELTGSMVNLPFELPIFAILLVVLGGITFAQGWVGRNQIQLEE